MLYLLLESIYMNGKLNECTDIFIYTSTAFMQKIKNSSLYCEKIVFEINDNYDSIDLACKARLDAFELPKMNAYDKCLYLDTDVLVIRDLNPVFDIIKKEVIYAMEEGTIDDPQDFWGTTLFGKEAQEYADKTAFSSGVMAFTNCEKMRTLFLNIKEDMKNRRYTSEFHDQPFIVYNAIKQNAVDKKMMLDFVIINEDDIHSDKTIVHFAGWPGLHTRKQSLMETFMNKLKDDVNSKNIKLTKDFINEHLIHIIRAQGEPLEGNIFMIHHTMEYTNVFENKVKNISNLVLNKNIRNVLEIGFNAGFSTLLMLLSNPYMKITCVDLGEHKYTVPCYEKIKEFFGDRINIIISDSTVVLPRINDTYDLIHIDGGHDDFVATNDIINCYRLSKNKTILIMDDYDFPNLHSLWDEYVLLYNLKLPNTNNYISPHHDIKVVTK
jgi:predicted O-methyltransferase YrrM